jgi:hypothetical protein
MTADPSTLTAEDRALAAFFEARMSDLADDIVSDLVARVTADDAERDALIADLVVTVRWYQGSLRLLPTAAEKLAVGRALTYIRTLP